MFSVCLYLLGNNFFSFWIRTLHHHTHLKLTEWDGWWREVLNVKWATSSPISGAAICSSGGAFTLHGDSLNSSVNHLGKKEFSGALKQSLFFSLLSFTFASLNSIKINKSIFHHMFRARKLKSETAGEISHKFFMHALRPNVAAWRTTKDHECFRLELGECPPNW